MQKHGFDAASTTRPLSAYTMLGACLEPSSFVSVAKYSKILSGPLRSRMRFSYLKKVLCLVDSGKSCQDCNTSRRVMCNVRMCCRTAQRLRSSSGTVDSKLRTFSSGCIVATSSALAVSMQPIVAATAAGQSHSLERCLLENTGAPCQRAERQRNFAISCYAPVVILLACL